MALNFYALSLFITATISGSLALYVWLRRAATGGTLFALMLAAVTLWALAYGLELASTELATMRFWVVVQYLGIGATPVLWLLFTIHYSGWRDRLPPRRAALLFVVPAISVALNATNEHLHYFHYSVVELDSDGPFPLLATKPGPWYWFHVGYAYSCILGGMLILAHLWRHTPQLYRRQVTLLLLGACLPLAANIAYMAGLRPLEQLDLSPLAFTVTGLLVTIGIFRYSLFELTPIARHALFESLRDPVLVVDARGRLADLNRAAQLAFGGRLRPGLTTASALALWPDLAMLCAGSGEGHAEIRLAAGAAELYDGIGTPLSDRRGHPLGRIVVLRDIGERRRIEAERLALERQVQHTQKLESLGVLAGGIAHDYSNLLMAILGNLDLARFDMEPGHPAQEPLGDAERAARRAADLTRQLLVYAGKSTMVTRPLDLSRLVEEIAQLLQLSVGRLIDFDLRLDHELPLLEGDPAQLQQIVLNLTTNASEAIGRRAGTIALTTGVRACDAAELSQSRLEPRPAPGMFVALAVSDSGGGMDPATSARLFEPFFTTKQMGRGLGMAAVLGIVRMHGGAITVASEPGRGTTVTVLFPVEGQPGAESAPPPECAALQP